MNKLRIALIAAAGLAATPALAQDASEFTGPRAEATIGFDQIRFDLASATDGREKQADLGYGVAIGYDVAVAPKLIAGVDVGVNLADTGYSYGDATDGGELRKRREITAAARLGTPITSNTLLYGKLGYANLQLREDLTSAGVTSSSRNNLDGVLLGAGVEVKLLPNAYWKSEYRYTDYARGIVTNNVTTGVGIRF
ncbi:porin family protein [Sphingomonas sp. HITSZ_GF]|uniref:outer membrane protein n=1 Tax=Sphingomonas sp. HITSZ_GF TaxID=3037247 RepID=UPI00240E0DA1|nr:porin family protein [Sphingomonas sp. HITSZ_GF]MDG2535306.1 porin family protein [Sphingomonas sp. HITSZ_GF]